MKDRIANITKWILYVLLFISALAGVLFYTGMLGAKDGSGASDLIVLADLFVILALVVLIVTPVYTIITNPQNLSKMLISVVLLIVVLAVSYGLSSNAFSPLYLETYKTTAETSRLVGAGLYAIYITLGLSFVAILYSGIMNIFK